MDSPQKDRLPRPTVALRQLRGVRLRASTPLTVLCSPFLWFDRRGNWHIIYHVFCLDPFDAHNECTSGHAFSEV